MDIAKNLLSIYTSLNSVLINCNDALIDKGQTSAKILNDVAPRINQIKTGAELQLTVVAPVGSNISVSDGNTLFTASVGSGGEHIFNLPNGGEWTVTAIIDSSEVTSTVSIQTEYELNMAYSFEDMSWSEIISACKSKQIPSSWQIGDTKEMEFSGNTYPVVIIGFNHDDYSDGSGKAPVTFFIKEPLQGRGFAWSNSLTLDAWSSCDLRESLNSDSYIAGFGEEIGSAIKSVDKKYTLTSGVAVGMCSDRLSLLSSGELWGNNSPNTGSQYDYFKESGNRIIGKFGAIDQYWTRQVSFRTFGALDGATGEQVGVGLPTEKLGVLPIFCF